MKRKFNFYQFESFLLNSDSMSKILGGDTEPGFGGSWANGWCTATANCANGSTVSCKSRNGTCSADDQTGQELDPYGGVLCFHANGAAPTIRQCPAME